MRLSLFVALVVATIALCSFSPASANEAAQIDEKVLADFLAELTESDNAGRNLRTIQTVEDEEDSIDAQNEERAGGTALEHAAKQFAALGKGNLTPIDKAKLASQLEKMKSVARQFNAAGKGQLQALEKGQGARHRREAQVHGEEQQVADFGEEAQGVGRQLQTSRHQGCPVEERLPEGQGEWFQVAGGSGCQGRGGCC
ncbi:unnamed protein product [Phytophthora lilii]|uniref:RxLR effector protein n=1 Tax=Phytophthora lilii TaxID=2077276 RepID=A0A9W6UDK9_9STRA|nr:unnamed protein product [Phytophthora lilii]